MGFQNGYEIANKYTSWLDVNGPVQFFCGFFDDSKIPEIAL
jgi:hypothetical protein